MDVSYKKLSVLLANESHSKDIWLWRNDPLTRAMFREYDYVEWNSHKKWYSKMLKDRGHLLLYGLLGENGIGMVRFDRLNKDIAEVSINLSPDYRKKGLSSALLLKGCKVAFEKLGVMKLFAEIKKDNFASQKAFEKIGFLKVEEEKSIYFHYELTVEMITIYNNYKMELQLFN